MTCARAVCPTLVKKDCTAWLADLDRAMPTIVFRVEGPSGESVKDLVLKLDQAAVPVDDKPRPVDPGAHVVRVERADQPPYEEPLAVRAGEKDRVFVIKLPASAGSPTTAPPVDEATSPRPLVGWIVGGAGAAALAISAGFWIAGVTSESHLRSTCGVAHSCSQRDVDASHGKLVVGDVIGAFGATAVVVGGGLLLFYRPSAKTAVALTPARGGASLVAGGTF